MTHELPPSRHLRVDGVNLHYRELAGPPGAPALLFTHGGGPGSGAWSNFQRNAEAFSARYHCYFLDLPQFGGSDRVPVAGPVFTWHANKLRGFLDGLGIDRVHLVNQSFGGCVAIRFAAEHPERVASLVVIASQPVARGVMQPLPLFSKHAAGLIGDYYLADGGPSLEKMRALICRYELHDDDRLDEQALQLRYADSCRPGFVELLQTPGAFGEWEDLTSLFSRVRAPSLIFWGLHDWFGGIDVPMLMLNQFADARLYVMGNAAHHLQSECPDEFNAAALAFLEELS
ncbi:alpha/beta fold hydrolase [Pseudomonas sp. ZM23]|uniref:Alpha/beta hydrolase n=1 Tax=Pseudomonas triclosanedens TaxID=2961893 RepID=A0ABY6ZQ44_9PSED|nr:alpha/beta hydrolase [Pseudomonas triclosanedens]MCP8467509.1 alpha/beta fold hydrolase [Pseudomonas triclosanedens]MCP8471686.1 alpha/beta fold hydrolase [Pseudomonas triclosanedens]MCP8478961.1 alpha/beta fold hydrolase [Pseudomonas triclosanedens]WAI47027.1 alpha/beta hydrolase [Pseudomonas triclosanedens]